MFMAFMIPIILKTILQLLFVIIYNMGHIFTQFNNFILY